MLWARTTTPSTVANSPALVEGMAAAKSRLGTAHTNSRTGSGGSAADARLGATLQSMVETERETVASKKVQVQDFSAIREKLMSLLQVLHSAYSEESFQAEVREAHRAAGGNKMRAVFTLGPVVTRVQDPIFKRFGLPAGNKGVVLMKNAVQAASQNDPPMKAIAGDLRELLGLDREEVLIQWGTSVTEDAWVSKAARYRESAQQRMELLQKRVQATPSSSEDDDSDAVQDDWRPAGLPTFFLAQDARVSDKTPMGKPPELFPGRTLDRSFGSPAMMVTDRYEMNTWLARSITRFSSALGDEASARLFDDKGSLGPASKPKIIYIAGVEGTGHHGFGPMLAYPAVRKYGEGTFTWWRSLREVLMKTPPRHRRAKLRKLMTSMDIGSSPHFIFESASYPFGEEGRERWAAGCEDPEALQREEQSGNPGNSVDLGEFIELFQEYGEVKVLVLHRSLAAAAWSHKEWDDGLVEHARILVLFAEYLTKVLSGLNPDMWRWVAYEDVCKAHESGNFAALDPLADFLELPRAAMQRSFECFRPSKKNAAAEMASSSLAVIQALEKQGSKDWFPARFPKQELFPVSR